jgi:hypothetical protein
MHAIDTVAVNPLGRFGEMFFPDGLGRAAPLPRSSPTGGRGYFRSREPDDCRAEGGEAQGAGGAAVGEDIGAA